MLKKYDEALKEKMKQSPEEFPDCSRKCNVVKLLRDETTIEPSKRKPKSYKSEVFEYHKMHLFNERLASKTTQSEDMEKIAMEEEAKPEPIASEVPPEAAPETAPQPAPEVIPEVEPKEEEKAKGDHVEEPAEAIEEPVEPEEYVPYVQDHFRDGLRRIDLVLVAADDGDIPLSPIKTFFLQNILKVGLDIEINPGVMRMHRNLMFIKIHGPDKVLDEYNHAFNSKKYFKDGHLKFLRPNLTTIGSLLPFTRVTHERELIALARTQYKEKLHLSNEERSHIVYKILLELPFGDTVKSIGINRLLDRRIFLDVYALHDGPHFLAPNQDWNTITARQMLFYHWVGKRNVYKLHPLNLIREYFGEKVGMYFAFYEFYNHALFVPAIVGSVLFLAAMGDTTDDYFVNDICKDKNKTYICPRCKVFQVCRFIKLTNLCNLAKLHKVLDSPVTLLYSICLVLWGLTFYVLWKRKENYWNWMWEIDTDRTKEIFRPECTMYPEIRPQSRRTGLMQQSNTDLEKFGRRTVVTVACILLLLVPVGLLVPLFYDKFETDGELVQEKKTPLHWEEIVFVAVFAAKHVVFEIVGEFVYRLPIRYINLMENHRTYASYQRGLSFKTFAASFMFTFPIMYYYAMFKGAEYFLPMKTFPGLRKEEIWTKRRALYSLTHCGPFTCLDEVFFMLFATLLIRQIAIPFLLMFKALIFNTRTDFNQGKRVNKRVPAWEREYRLEPVTDVMMTRKLHNLMTQFTLVTLVGTVFSLAPLMVLVCNICHIRHEARLFTQCRRRPLLVAAPAFGLWTPLLKHLAFLSVPSNGLMLSSVTKTAARIIYMNYSGPGTMKGFLFFMLFKMNTTDYHYLTRFGKKRGNRDIYLFNKTNFVPKSCYFPGIFLHPTYKEVQDYYRDDLAMDDITYQFYNDYKRDYGYWYRPRYVKNDELSGRTALGQEYFLYPFGACVLFMTFSVAGLLYGLVLDYAVPPYSNQLERVRVIEMKMKNAFIRLSKKLKDAK